MEGGAEHALNTKHEPLFIIIVRLFFLRRLQPQRLLDPFEKDNYSLQTQGRPNEPPCGSGKLSTHL